MTLSRARARVRDAAPIARPGATLPSIDRSIDRSSSESNSRRDPPSPRAAPISPRPRSLSTPQRSRRTTPTASTSAPRSCARSRRTTSTWARRRTTRFDATTTFTKPTACCAPRSSSNKKRTARSRSKPQSWDARTWSSRKGTSRPRRSSSTPRGRSRMEARGTSSRLLMKARLLYDRGQFAEALQWYRRALRSQGAAAPAGVRLGIGACQYQLGNFEGARLAFERTIQLEPTNVDALVGLASVEFNASVRGAGGADARGRRPARTVHPSRRSSMTPRRTTSPR